MSGMWTQCAPRSNGTPNVVVSVTQRPPTRCGGFDQGEAPARRRQPPRRRDAGGARPHDDHVDAGGPRRHLRARRGFPGDRGRHRRPEHRAGRHGGAHGGGGSEERPAIQSSHDVPCLSVLGFMVSRRRNATRAASPVRAQATMFSTVTCVGRPVWPESAAARKRSALWADMSTLNSGFPLENHDARCGRASPVADVFTAVPIACW